MKSKFKPRMNTVPQTIVGNLIYIIRMGACGLEILLPIKAATEKALKRGLAHKRNSYGGGLEKTDASHLSSVLRELREESGITLQEGDVKKAAVVTFHNTWGSYECHIFVSYFGNSVTPKESREMLDPQWFSLDEIPFHDMLEGDTLTLPRILAKGPTHTDVVQGEIWYDESMRVIRSMFKKQEA